MLFHVLAFIFLLSGDGAFYESPFTTDRAACEQLAAKIVETEKADDKVKFAAAQCVEVEGNQS